MSNFIKIFLFLLLLVYIISPFDFIPDLIPFFGWLDDIGLIAIFIYYLRRGNVSDIYSWIVSFFRKNQFNYHDNYQGEEKYRESETKSNKKKSKTDSHSNYQSKKETFAKNPYEILGLKPGANIKEIQAAYRKAAQSYHPDKVTHLGEEFQKLAQVKFIEIQEAYDQLIQQAEE